MSTCPLFKKDEKGKVHSTPATPLDGQDLPRIIPCLSSSQEISFFQRSGKEDKKTFLHVQYKIVAECQGGRTASPVNVPGDDALIAPLDSGFCLVFFGLSRCHIRSHVSYSLQFILLQRYESFWMLSPIQIRSYFHPTARHPARHFRSLPLPKPINRILACRSATPFRPRSLVSAEPPFPIKAQYFSLITNTPVTICHQKLVH
ncbi:hypothetical protein B0J14DRAFT_35278 [Halenospora varia]|nr:hypothetical protein B0J14DRAFT_35278 [Halenospora varia]